MLTPEEVQANKIKYGIGTKQQGAPENKIGGYFSRVGSTFKKESLGVVDSIMKGAELAAGAGVQTKPIEERIAAPIEGATRAGLGAVGGVIRATLSPVTEAISPVIAPFVEKSLGGEKTQEVLQKINAWSEQHPDAAANLKDIFEIVTTIGGGAGLKAAAPAIESVAEKSALAGLKATEVAGNVLQAGGKELVEKGIGLSAKEAPLVQAYKAKVPFLTRMKAALFGEPIEGAPITTADTATRQAIFGTESGVGIKAKQAATKIWDGLISPALESSEKKINMGEFLDEVGNRIEKETSDLSRKNDLLEALQSLKDDYKDVGEIPLEELQKIKEDWARFVPEKAYKGKPIAGAFNEVKNKAAGLAREKIYTELGEDVRLGYFDYGNLVNLQELGQKAMTGGKLKGGWGGFFSGLKDIAVTPVSTIGGQVLYKTGQGLEFVGKQGAKKLIDLFQ